MDKLVRADRQNKFQNINKLFSERIEALKYYYTPDNMAFFGSSEKELMVRLSYHLREAEYDASFAMLATIESALRCDAEYRHKKRLKDQRSQAVSRLLKQVQYPSYRYVKTSKIVETLKHDDSVPQHTLSLLKRYFKYRNWLAHGRYWEPDFGEDTPVFSDIYQLALEIEAILYH